MAQMKLLTEREESRLAVLAESQPKTAKALQTLIEKIKTGVIRAALNDPQIAELLKEKRFRLLGTDFRDEKPVEGDEIARRLMEIGLYNYDDNVLIVLIIDLRQGEIVSIEERRGYHPALVSEEIEEAKNIVLEDPQFEALKEHPELEVVGYPARASVTESHPGFGHRCATLYFWTGGEQPERVSQAVVDLSAQKVVPGYAEGEPFVEPQGTR